MTTEIIVGLLSLTGTLIGSLLGILAANKLINYRLQQLEKKVELHNNAVERLFKVEGQVVELQHDMKDVKGRI